MVKFVKKKQEITLEEVYEIKVDENHLTKLIEEEKQKEIFRLLLTLKSSYREIIVQYYYNNLSLKEIAYINNMKYSNAKVLLSRARKEFAKKVKEKEL